MDVSDITSLDGPPTPLYLGKADGVSDATTRTPWPTMDTFTNALAILILCAVPPGVVAQLPEPLRVDSLGDGVFMVWDSDGLANPVHGNTTFIIGEDDVVVVDASRTASAARATIAILRSLTDKPVRRLVNTHWHEDHVLGNVEYAAAFPEVAIIGHAVTRSEMVRESGEFPAFAARLPGLLEDVQGRIASNADRNGRPLSAVTRRRLEDQRVMYEYLIPEDASARWVFPTQTFDSRVILFQGDREIRLIHPGRANTAGDVVVFLPGEKILITGDVVVFPVPYAGGSFPQEWLEVLNEIDTLDFEVLIPGHGPVQRDRTYFSRLTDLIAFVVAEIESSAQRGETGDEIVTRLSTAPPIVDFTADNSEAARVMTSFFLRPAVRRALELR